jgi:hypothetical protein
MHPSMPIHPISESDDMTHIRITSHRRSGALLALAAAALTACGTTNASTRVESGSSSRTAPTGTTAEIATLPGGGPLLQHYSALGGSGSSVWVLGPSSLSVSPTGAQWTTLSLPSLPASSAIDDVAVLPKNTVVVALSQDEEHLVIATRQNGASNWSASNVTLPRPAGSVQVVTGSAGLDGVMVTDQTSSNFSQGVWVRESSTGWTTSATPAGGYVSDADGLWLVGGVLGDNVYRSNDDGLSWAAVTLPGASGNGTDGNGATFSPITLTPTGLTTTATQSSTVTVLEGTATDGAVTWKSGPSFTVPTSYGPGAGPNTAVGNGTLWVASGSSAIARVDLMANTVAHTEPNGLPVGTLVTLHPTGTESAWATASCAGAGTCAPALFETTNGGATWVPHPDPGS